MLESSSVDLKTFHVGLISYTKSNSFSKHGLVAVHVVVHYVLQFGHQSLWVDEIEVNLFVSCNLDSDVSFDKEQEALVLERMKLLPTSLIIFI